MDALATALQLICAWSSIYCGVMQRIPISMGDTFYTDVQGGVTQLHYPLGITRLRNWNPVSITVSERLTHPVAIAEVLAHELYEVQEGVPPHGHDCEGFEGWPGQQAFGVWFAEEFGPPVGGNSWDALTFALSVPGKQPYIPC